MIALVSSTVFPPREPIYDGPRSWLSGDARLQQTCETVRSLHALGAREIVVADNSGDGWRSGAEVELLPARVLRLATPQFRNKGISELHLLRAALPSLGDDEPILKISGRYTLSRDLCAQLDDHDVLGRIYRQGRQWSLSTRCYLVRDRETFAMLIDEAFRELYATPARIVGPRSLLRIVHNSLRPPRDEYPYDDPPVSIERAFGEVLRRRRFRFRSVERLGVEGVLGLQRGTYISE
jgi:hypothetical protein